MKKYINLLLSSFILSLMIPLSYSVFASKNQKIAVVDVQLVVDKSLAMNSIKKQSEHINSDLHNKFQKKEIEIKNMEKKLLDIRDKVSKEEFEIEKEKYNKMVNDIQKNSEENTTKLYKANSQAVEKLHKATIEVISEIAKERNIDIVFPKAYILYHNSADNFTDLVINRLDKRYPKIDLNF